MSVETKPNKLVKGLVLDTFHTDVDNTVATYALNSQLEDQEGNHFHYGSEVGTTYIRDIPTNHVVVGHINMERNETVLFTTDGTNSTIGILSRKDDMSYQYEIKVDDSKQAKKLNFKKNTYIRGVYRLLNGCDKIIYFVDGINKDRRININQLDSYKTSDIEYIPPVVIPEEVIPEIPIIVDNTLQVIVYALSSATGNIQLIRLLQTNVSAIGSINATLESSQQGLVLIDVTLSGVASSTVTLLRAALLETNVTAQATTIVDIIVTKIIDAQVQALANTTTSAQISISVNATVNAVTETSATVQLSKVISTSVDALANSSSEALIGLVLVSTNTGSASISTADLYINRLLTSSVTAQGTTTAELIIAELLSSAMTASANTTANLQLADVLTTSVSAAATVTNATLTSTAPLLLDLYPSAAAAYSLRKLRTAYSGNAIKVRRSSDNTELDIGFINNILDTVSLLTFCGINNGFVTTWYDQSGNSRNATMTTAANQPQIVSSGVVVLTNTKPALKFVDLNDHLQIASNFATFNNTTIFNVCDPLNYTGISQNARFYDLFDGTNRIQYLNDANSSRLHVRNNLWQTGIIATQFTTQNSPTNQFLSSVLALSSSNDLYLNNNIQSKISGNFAGDGINASVIGQRGDVANTTNFIGDYQELIVYQTDQSTNRTAINNNINTYYGIF